MTKLKVVITGASGLLGRAVYQEAQNRNFEVTGLAYSRTGKNLVKCDLTKQKEIEELIQNIKPDFIVHAAAERSPENVENDYEKTKNLNIESSRRLSQVANSVGSRIIYISTDYVFDGTSPPYDIHDKVKPLNKYGLTKLEGENAVLDESKDACVLRIPILYGQVEKIEESAVTTLLQLLLSKEPKAVSNYEKRYPSHTCDISKIICDLIEKLQLDSTLKGIFHWSGKEQLTKYDMVLAIGKAFSLTTDHLSADSNPSIGAPRPVDAQLVNSRLENLGISHHTSFAEGIKDSLSPWVPSPITE